MGCGHFLAYITTFFEVHAFNFLRDQFYPCFWNKAFYSINLKLLKPSSLICKLLLEIITTPAQNICSWVSERTGFLLHRTQHNLTCFIKNSHIGIEFIKFKKFFECFSSRLVNVDKNFLITQ